MHIVEAVFALTVIAILAAVGGLWVYFTWLQPIRERREAARLPIVGQWIAIPGYGKPIQVVRRDGDGELFLSYEGDLENVDHRLPARHLTTFEVLPFGHASRYREWLAEQAEGGLTLIEDKEKS